MEKVWTGVSYISGVYWKKVVNNRQSSPHLKQTTVSNPNQYLVHNGWRPRKVKGLHYLQEAKDWGKQYINPIAYILDPKAEESAISYSHSARNAQVVDVCAKVMHAIPSF